MGTFSSGNNAFPFQRRCVLWSFLSEMKNSSLMCYFYQSTVVMDGDQLVHVQKWDGKETTFVREIKDGKMVMVRLFTVCSVYSYLVNKLNLSYLLLVINWFDSKNLVCWFQFCFRNSPLGTWWLFAPMKRHKFGDYYHQDLFFFTGQQHIWCALMLYWKHNLHFVPSNLRKNGLQIFLIIFKKYISVSMNHLINNQSKMMTCVFIHEINICVPYLY